MTIKEKAARIAESFAVQFRVYGLGLDETVLNDCAANAAMALEEPEEPSTVDLMYAACLGPRDGGVK